MTPPREQLGRAYFVEPPLPARAEVVIEPREKLQLALDRHVGVRADSIQRACESVVYSTQAQTRLWFEQRAAAKLHADWTIRPASSFLEAFDACKSGVVSGSGRVSEAQASADFSTILGNTLGRRLLAAYADADYGERSLFLPGSASSLRDQRVVGLDEPQDVPVVDPEVSDYSELPKLGERAGAYAMIQRGVILTVTRKLVLNDDVVAVQRMVDGLGQAARRTLARAVYAPWIANSNALDGVAWFHSDHANIQSSALSKTEAIAAIRKLLDMTMPGNVERMSTRVKPGSLWLMVPNALWDTAYALNQETGSALYHLFGVFNEYIIVNPLLTDPNDWSIHRDAREVESVRISYLNGREEPSLFLADTPNADQLFIGDRLAYKLRHEYGTAVADHRGAVKAVVA